METITYLNIKVEGVPYTKILSLHIQNAINGYGSAYIEGEIDSEKGNAYVQRLTSDTIVKITTTADGQPPILFMGVVCRFFCKPGNGLYIIEDSAFCDST